MLKRLKSLFKGEIMETTHIIDIFNQRNPELFIDSITFNDRTKLSLKADSVVVFTGANNCGKSQILKDIHLGLSNSSRGLKTISEISPCFRGSITDDFMNSYFHPVSPNSLGEDYVLNKYDDSSHQNNRYSKKEMNKKWRDYQLDKELYGLFVRLITAETRLTTSKSFEYSGYIRENLPIIKAYENQEFAGLLSNFFRQAFDEDLIMHARPLGKIQLHVGEAPDKDAYTMAQELEYYGEITKLPNLDEQGDGMRAFASVLLEAFANKYTVTLIDEPEAFLHPPQARMIGKILAQSNLSGRQLFVATHSEDFLQGLLDADNKNLIVIRIHRDGTINHMNVLENSKIKELWSNPILRYSNIFKGLFHKKVILCESDYDCLFYQAIMDAIYESKSEVPPDILFIHCGGWKRMKDVVRPLKALNVPIVALPDFDVIVSRNEFKELTKAFDIDWTSIFGAGWDKSDKFMKEVHQFFNAKQEIKKSIKKIGRNAFTGNVAIEYANVEKTCRSAGLLIAPNGEMEGFVKDTTLEKGNWVYHVISTHDLANDPKLRDAREFVQAAIDF